MKISVALCTYNGSRFLRTQLESIFQQTRAPDELVICDDVSSDQTVSLIEQMMKDAPFPVHLHVNSVNLRSTKNFEQAIQHCRGDIIFLSDQDDRWLPNKVERLEAIFRDRPSVGLVATDAYQMNQQDEMLPTTLWSALRVTPAMQRDFSMRRGTRVMLRRPIITGATCAFRASWLPLLLPIPAEWVHDAWISFMLAAVSDCQAIAEPLTVYRSHASQQIGATPLTFWNRFKTAQKMDAGYFRLQKRCFEIARERLLACGLPLHPPNLLDHVNEKIQLADSQMRMRETNRLGRLPKIVGNLLHGRYHRVGHGFLQVAADMFL